MRQRGEGWGNREKGKGWRREGNRVNGRDRTGHGVGQGEEGKEEVKGNGGGATAPKLQFLVPLLVSKMKILTNFD